MQWRSEEVIKLLRQCVVCPQCGVLVATQAGINAHIKWHNDLTQYVANVDARLEQITDYIINPETGLQKQIEDRLDTITDYIIAPVTGLEARTVAAIQQTNAAVQQLRTDATGAINGLNARVTALETNP
jgi:hypothetical protein